MSSEYWQHLEFGTGKKSTEAIIDAALAELVDGEARWADVTLSVRASLLKQVLTLMSAHADEWVATAAAKRDRYSFDRERAVKQLRREIPELAATGERKDRIKADLKRHRLQELLAVPPQTVDDNVQRLPDTYLEAWLGHAAV